MICGILPYYVFIMYMYICMRRRRGGETCEKQTYMLRCCCTYMLLFLPAMLYVYNLLLCIDIIISVWYLIYMLYICSHIYIALLKNIISFEKQHELSFAHI